MQIESIEHCNEDQIVWHPVWGGGRIKQVNIYSIAVQFIDSGGWVAFYTKDWENDITHLYTEPVFICERIINGHDTEIRYKPVKETK